MLPRSLSSVPQAASSLFTAVADGLQAASIGVLALLARRSRPGSEACQCIRRGFGPAGGLDSHPGARPQRRCFLRAAEGIKAEGARVYLGAIHNMAGFEERIAMARKYLPKFGLGAYCGFG